MFIKKAGASYQCAQWDEGDDYKRCAQPNIADEVEKEYVGEASGKAPMAMMTVDVVSVWTDASMRCVDVLPGSHKQKEQLFSISSGLP